MPKAFLIRLACACTLAASAQAQLRVSAAPSRSRTSLADDAPIRPPALGHYLSEGRLRLIAGLPGAAISLPSPLPFGFAAAAEPPSRAYLLGIDAGSRTALLLYETPEGVAVTRSLETAAPPERLLLSPSGSAAAIRTTEAWEVWTGLPAAPERSLTLEAHDAPAAVSDSGEFLLAGHSPSLAALDEIAALAFRHGSTDALAATPRAVFLLREGALEPLALELPREARIAAVAFDREGTAAIAAITNPGSVAEIGLLTRESRSTPCDCSPATLIPIDGTRLFRITEPTPENPGVLLYDGAASEPRILFVAAPAADPNGGIE